MDSQPAVALAATGERGRLHPQRTPGRDVLERCAQAAMVVVFDGHEAERLQNAARQAAHGTEHFGHAMNRAGLGLERNFDELALPERFRQLQKAASHRNALEFGFGAPPVF